MDWVGILYESEGKQKPSYCDWFSGVTIWCCPFTEQEGDQLRKPFQVWDTVFSANVLGQHVSFVCPICQTDS